ncbi:MAG: adenosylcobinamide-phosphate synthase CbiB [Chloroflexi bacterium]|nr:adenosylcobinamide-phosphate synthase CbiB [Chloroflexota bacterium]
MLVRPRSALALATGVALDVALIDPPNAVHPVALIGRAARAVERCAPTSSHARRRFGLAAALALPLVAFEVTRRLERSTRGGWLVAALLLSLASSQRTLVTRVAEVRDALARGDLETARALLALHLVSRDTTTLDASEVAAATIESLAENLSDGVVAPCLAFALGGAPLAWAYRTSNTLDAMWGYRTERYEDLGKAAARIDDAWNLLPARLTALAIVLATLGGQTTEVWRAWRRDASSTVSPNAGHPMAAMAGATGVRLSKRGAYDLNASGRPASAADITRALRIARRATALVAGALLLGMTARGRLV